MVYQITAEESELKELRIEKMKSLCGKINERVGVCEDMTEVEELIKELSDLHTRRIETFGELFRKAEAARK